VVNTVAEALHGTAVNSTLYFVLDFKTVTELGKMEVAELK
jgi:hypothetical protein